MARTLLAIYPHSARRYDEMLSADGGVRPHWRQFFIHLDSVAPDEMHQRLELRRPAHPGKRRHLQRLCRPRGADRPWALDPLPLIIPPDEWAEVVRRRRPARHPAQRHAGRPLRRADQLLAEGLLPPALVYGQHGYLWPCQGIKPPAASGCTTTRSIWRARRRPLVGHRRPHAGAVGAGYALENRLVVSRVFPEMFRDLHVQHLADSSATSSTA
jgi:uncharacterized circularly permuted ATP-grasp superfamily protein